MAFFLRACYSLKVILWLRLVIVLLGASLSARTADLSGSTNGGWTNQLRDLHGETLQPFPAPQVPATVFLFLATDCPISNRYAPELQRLGKQFSDDAVRFYLVYVDPGLAAEDFRKHQKEYQLPGTIALDPKHALIEAARIKVTPETAVFDRTGRLVYHGRIDDRYPALGQVRRRVQKRELADTLTSLARKHPVLTSSQPAVGCPIPPRL